jgi:hypothetical protein
MQTMTCPRFNETVSIVDDKFRHREVRNNKSIHAGFHEGLQPVPDFLYRCRRNHGHLSMYSSIIFAPAALNPPT